MKILKLKFKKNQNFNFTSRTPTKEGHNDDGDQCYCEQYHQTDSYHDHVQQEL